MDDGFRLAGLQELLQQKVPYKVERLQSLNGVTGDSVLTNPVFIDNIMTFPVAYGLALQAIGMTRIRMSLLPREIRRKQQRKNWWKRWLFKWRRG